MMKRIAILGASGGIGAICAEHLAHRAPLLLGYRGGREKCENLAARLSAAGHDVEAVQVDVADAESVGRFIRKAEEQGGLAGVVGAFGPVMPLKPFVEVTEAEFDRIYATDVRGAFNVITAGSRALRASGGGVILWILTTASLRTLENDGMSAGPKTAVAAMIKQVAREMGRYNVRCNGVALAAIDTGMVHAPEFANDVLAQGVIQTMIRNTPLGRMGRPGEVGAVIDFLISPGAGYINGQILGVDGGFSA